MTPLRQQMIAALQLSGKGEWTQQAYVREVRLLSQFYGKSPDVISEPEVQTYFLHRRNVDQLAPASMRICYSGIRKVQDKEESSRSAATSPADVQDDPASLQACGVSSLWSDVCVSSKANPRTAGGWNWTNPDSRGLGQHQDA